MMWFPERPEFDSGMLCIPEILNYEEIETETDGVDSFVQVLIECMSKSLRGGSNG